MELEFHAREVILDTPEGHLVTWRAHGPYHQVSSGSAITPFKEKTQLTETVSQLD